MAIEDKRYFEQKLERIASEHLWTIFYLMVHLLPISVPGILMSEFSGDAVIIMSEMLKIFVIEAAARTARQASNEDARTADLDHFEKVLPQLLLDF
ncbi:centromere protein X isoform X1 [Stegostoma tigrinum]|uniref:centromere protein X isoform X1 n=1 Tax=Stegostoma tigrinum TaxID=3053191 RepID=UPI00202B3488|nr:centromere protein X isoform X1 [Stegostoma tigrinum]